ncbi:HCP-like protein [Xylariaceae sp. AK1471]|nr:HCP-like protein [Xylariaceae sp. AK1471]
MGLRDLIKKKDGLGERDVAYSETLNKLAGPEFTFIRSDTNTHEIIYPPNHPANDRFLRAREPASTPSKSRRSLDIFHPRSRGNSLLSSSGDSDGDNNNNNSKVHRRLSHRLGLSRHAPKTSEYVPENLPQINVTSTPDDPTAEENKEAQHQWEKRATILATTNEERQRSRSRSVTASPSPSSTNLSGLDSGNNISHGGTDTTPPKNASAVVSSQETDRDIQEAIRLHEEGDLERSTQLFGRLADPYGANNPLSQVLYGLALRHGWGCEPDPERAVTYLSAAASNAATVETMALKAGLKKGGAAKGELVLAIFELANCFRHGWGIAKDPVAAKQYYETAANLGDTDAMNETAWCYLEGFGCKKDKFQAARYYRLAEKNGSKTLGNTWIWKEKYNPK